MTIVSFVLSNVFDSWIPWFPSFDEKKRTHVRKLVSNSCVLRAEACQFGTCHHHDCVVVFGNDRLGSHGCVAVFGNDRLMAPLCTYEELMAQERRSYFLMRCTSCACYVSAFCMITAWFGAFVQGALEQSVKAAPRQKAARNLGTDVRHWV